MAGRMKKTSLTLGAFLFSVPSFAAGLPMFCFPPAGLPDSIYFSATIASNAELNDAALTINNVETRSPRLVGEAQRSGVSRFSGFKDKSCSYFMVLPSDLERITPSGIFDGALESTCRGSSKSREVQLYCEIIPNSPG